MNAFAENYRIFELPWTPSEDEERRFKKLLWSVLGFLVAFALVLPWLPVPERIAPPPLPEEVVRIVLPPPPPPKPVEKPKEEPKPEPVKQEKPIPKPVDKTLEARKKAEKSGLVAMKDQLADLREALDPKKLETKDLLNKVEGPSRSERSLITSQVATATSGGINTASMSRGFGGNKGELGGHTTTQGVTSFADQINKGRAEATRSGTSGKAARSREEIEMVFDRNKAAIYALYNRALRDNPQLQGKVVVELSIAPSGEVTACRVVSSELNDPELERKLVARIKMFVFEARDVEAITTTKPIDFFPA
jgi:periplasmic protein TonB